MPTPAMTAEQKQEAVDALEKYGSQKAASEALGLSRTTFQSRLYAGIRAGLDQAIVHPAPQGHTVKGVSTLYAPNGAVLQQWVKTRAGEEDPLELAERLRGVLEGMEAAPVVPAPEHTNSDLLTVYAIADAHVGLRAWRKETGESYDVDIAVDRLRSWIGRLVASSPSSEEAIILDVGDTTHMDDGTNQTPASKHVLDVDGRYFRTLDMTIAAMADAVEIALSKHELVTVAIIAGNHNPNSYIAVLFALAERYRNNPRVTVRKDPREFWAHQFGANLIAAHHGDKASPERMVMFLADEYAAERRKTVAPVPLVGS